MFCCNGDGMAVSGTGGGLLKLFGSASRLMEGRSCLDREVHVCASRSLLFPGKVNLRVDWGVDTARFICGRPRADGVIRPSPFNPSVLLKVSLVVCGVKVSSADVLGSRGGKVGISVLIGDSNEVGVSL